MEWDVLDSTDTAAPTLDVDQTLISGSRVNRHGLFPGKPRWPLATQRKTSGRMAYIAAWLEPEDNRVSPQSSGHASKSGRLGRGTPPVETANVPPTVHVSLSESLDGRRLAVALTNQTTNPIRKWNEDVEYVALLADLCSFDS